MLTATYIVERANELLQIAKGTIDCSLSRKDISARLEQIGSDWLAKANDLERRHDRDARR